MKIDGYEVTPQGFLRIPVYAGRTGIQIYRDGNGKIIREYRPDEEVFSERTMSSLRCCPFTNDHPDEMVDISNAKELVCGMTVDHVEKVDSKYLKTYVVVYDKQAIEDIKRGKREVSLGYEVELDFTPGEFQGQKYDAIQRNIVNNHLALVDRARGGPQVRLRLDGRDAVLVTEHDNEQENLMKIKIGDKEFEVAQDLADAFTAHVGELEGKIKKGDEAATKVAGLETQVTELSGKVTTMGTEKETMQAKIDSLEADKAKGAGARMDSAEIAKGVKERRRLDKVAEKLMSKEEFEKTDAMSALELKKAVIKAECKDAVLDGKSEAYIDARFDHIADSLEVSGKANTAAGKKIGENRKEAGKEETKSDEARKSSMKADQEAWQKPLGKGSN